MEDENTIPVKSSVLKPCQDNITNQAKTSTNEIAVNACRAPCGS